MKKTISLRIIFLFSFFLFLFDLNAKGEKGNDILAIEAFVNAGNIYDGQSFCLQVKLYSSSPAIKYANLSESVELGERLHKLNIKDVRRSNRWTQDTYNGVNCYSLIIFETPLIAVKSGKVTIDPLKFNVGLINKTIVNDYFWGPIEKNSVENVVLSTNKLSFTINSLPSGKLGFSGAVGDFSLEAILPPGKIVSEQEIIVIYRLTGVGSLESAIFPDMKNILPDGLKFRSESIDESLSLINGNINSILEVEFTLFTSTDGTFTIPPVEMVIFNPNTNKYQTIKSKPLNIEVGNNNNYSKSSRKIYQI